jgi:hypothetical protein
MDDEQALRGRVTSLSLSRAKASVSRSTADTPEFVHCRRDPGVVAGARVRRQAVASWRAMPRQRSPGVLSAHL